MIWVKAVNQALLAFPGTEHGEVNYRSMTWVIRVRLFNTGIPVVIPTQDSWGRHSEGGQASSGDKTSLHLANEETKEHDHSPSEGRACDLHNRLSESSLWHRIGRSLCLVHFTSTPDSLHQPIRDQIHLWCLPSLHCAPDDTDINHISQTLCLLACPTTDSKLELIPSHHFTV